MAYQKDYQTSTVSRQNDSTYSIGQTTSAVYRHMYGWMTAALGLTGLTSFVTAERIVSSDTFARMMLSGPTMLILMIATFGLVVWISAGINRMSFTTATVCFAIYSVLIGVTLAPIFLIYETGSIAKVFLITAGTFGAMAAYGHFTKTDLSKVGQIAMMALLGIIIASVVNIFFKSSGMDYIISYLGIAVFCGLTMYDVQKMKQLIGSYGYEANDNTRKIALLGALTLYLDFINLFIKLLHILGNRRD